MRAKSGWPPAILGTAAAVGLLAGGVTAAGAAATKVVYVCGDNLCAVDPVSGRTAPVTGDGRDGAAYRAPSLTADGTHLAAVRADRVLLGEFGRPLTPWGPARVDHAAVAIAPTGKGAASYTRRTEYRNSPRCYWTPGGMHCDYLNRDLVTIENVFDASGRRLGGADGVAALPGGGLLVSENRWDEGREAVRSVLCVVGGATPEEGGYECRSQVEDPGRRLSEPAVSPDGRLYAATAYDRTADEAAVTIYDAAAGTVVRRFAVGSRSPAFSPDGRAVVFAASDGRIHEGVIASGATRPLAVGSDPTWGRGAPRVATAPTTVGGPLRLSNRRIAVRLRCAAGAPCQGSLQLRRGTLDLGATRYRLRAGRTGVVTLRPSARVLRQLTAGARRQTVRLTIRPTGAAPVTRTIILRR